MAVVKCVTSRLDVSFTIQDYLEVKRSQDARGLLVEKGRALAEDFLNVPPGRQNEWGRHMDFTRKATLLYGESETSVKYHHYIISPDPKDGVDLDRLRELSLGFAKRTFPNCQVAIVYHDDNTNGIPHAHLIVNNVDLETGLRLKISGSDFKANFRALQEDCKSLNLSAATLNVDREPEARKPFRTAERSYSKEEIGAIRLNDYSRKDDIASRVSVASRIARSQEEFERMLRKSGLTVTKRKGEYLFGLGYKNRKGEDRTFTVYGSTIGSAYTLRSITARIQRNEIARSSDPDLTKESLRQSASAEFGRIEYLGTVSAYVTARQLGNLLETCEAFDAYSLDDIDARRKDVGMRLSRARKNGDGSEGNQARLRDLSFKYRKLCEAREIFEDSNLMSLESVLAAQDEVERREAVKAVESAPGSAVPRRSEDVGPSAVPEQTKMALEYDTPARRIRR